MELFKWGQPLTFNHRDLRATFWTFTRPHFQMATLCGNLWEYNLTKVIVVDVSDDYQLAQAPMPSDFYPILAEAWLPAYRIDERLPRQSLVPGYLYDWHETLDRGSYYVGVIREDLAKS